VLALLVYQNPNLLLLDEPTNHLDLEMRHALSVALQEYEGALVVVSHDRHLLRSVTDQLLLVADGKIQAFDGDLDDYRVWLTEKKRGSEEVAPGDTGGGVSRKDQRRLEASGVSASSPFWMPLKRLRRRWRSSTCNNAIWKNNWPMPDLCRGMQDKLKQLLAQKIQVDAALEQAEIDWMMAEESLQQAELAVES